MWVILSSSALFLQHIKCVCCNIELCHCTNLYLDDRGQEDWLCGDVKRVWELGNKREEGRRHKKDQDIF